MSGEANKTRQSTRLVVVMVDVCQTSHLSNSITYALDMSTRNTTLSSNKDFMLLRRTDQADAPCFTTLLSQTVGRCDDGKCETPLRCWRGVLTSNNSIPRVTV